MYGWGGADPGTWKGPGKYKYDSARSPYLDSLGKAASAAGPRTYAAPSGPDMGLVNPRGKVISSDSKNPLVIAVDVTGSMNVWPREIFDRLPLLYQTLSQYRPDLEISFSAIGDANSDSFPIQVADFAKGLDLEKKLKGLFPEGGGGGQLSESYELFGQYIDTKCKTPNATSPFLMIFGDEKFYKNIEPAQVKHYIGDDIKDARKSEDMWKSLKQKFNVFYLQKEYDSGVSVTKDINEFWVEALGAEHVIKIPEMTRAVDVAMGIVAKNWGEYGDFKDNLSARHDPTTANSVHYSLRHLSDTGSKKSVLKLPPAKSVRKSGTV